MGTRCAIAIARAMGGRHRARAMGGRNRAHARARWAAEIARAREGAADSRARAREGGIHRVHEGCSVSPARRRMSCSRLLRVRWLRDERRTQLRTLMRDI